jgi:ribosomal protein S18 acetylase RimI-like enzyme
MLQKSVPFKSIYMKIDAIEIEKIQVPTLPVGYSYRFYQEGDQENWAKLETLVDEFATIEASRERFESEFLPSGDRYQALAQKFAIAENILDQRQVFIEDPNGEVVATATAWLANKFGEYQPILHWVSVHPDYQGLQLGKSVVAKAMSLFPKYEPQKDVMLHTQTWSYPAIVLYHKLGFYLCKTETLRPNDNDFDNGLADVLRTVIKEPVFSKLIAKAR